MDITRTVLACALALAASAVFAQATDAPAEKPPAATDCMKQHDHGAERQSPTPGKGCMSTQKSAKAKAPAKKIERHDHGKVHKNQ